MHPRNIRKIDIQRIEQNMRNIRSAVPESTKVLAVVKADGYGHGAVQTALAAIRGGAEMLAVATVSEGAELRDAGIREPVLVLGAVMSQDVSEGIRNDLTQTVCSPGMVEMCEEAASRLNMKANVHLKIDTGMGRIGIRNETERDQVIRKLEECPHVCLTGVFTHFADADGDEDGCSYTRRQFSRFENMTSVFSGKVTRHCCNSAAIARFPEMSLDMVRAGISLYGYPPVPSGPELKPCMSWSATVSFIKEIPAGAFISYGRTYRTDSRMRVGTVTCGYGDGYHRAASGKGFVLIRGKKANILGRICMDQMLVDLSGIDDASVGDEAVLIGHSGQEEITAEDIAAWSGTISYEVLLSCGGRVERVYMNNSEEIGGARK